MPPESTAVAPPRSLVRALRRVLRPLVRLLLAHQITYPFLANLLKTVYVELAERELAIPDKPQTISRLSLLTGIHRKDVKRLREEPLENDAPPPVVSLGAQLVARWTAVEAFLDENDHPRPLARLPGSANQPGFDDLVASVSKDIRARAVLDEWLRLGIAHIDEDDCSSAVLTQLVVDQPLVDAALKRDSLSLCRRDVEVGRDTKGAPFMFAEQPLDVA